MKPKVTLLANTPNPEKTVAMAAKLCYSPSSIEDIGQGLTEDITANFVQMLADLGHESPMEHVSFTFGIEDISRACSHQFVRHRIASYSQQSQRYVDGDAFNYVTPPEIAKNKKALKEYDNAIKLQQKAYGKVRDSLIIDNIKTFLQEDIKGTDEEIIKEFGKNNRKKLSDFTKKANEDARFILPNACTTAFVVTMNVRSLWNFFTLRCCNRAQWEIQLVADEMLKICKSAAPSLFKDCGPSCLRGKCPEGKMSCGKQKEVRDKYGR